MWWERHFTAEGSPDSQRDCLPRGIYGAVAKKVLKDAQRSEKYKWKPQWNTGFHCANSKNFKHQTATARGTESAREASCALLWAHCITLWEKNLTLSSKTQNTHAIASQPNTDRFPRGIEAPTKRIYKKKWFCDTIWNRGEKKNSKQRKYLKSHFSIREMIEWTR